LFPNSDRLRRYADAGLVDPESPRAGLIGYPKVDCLVDGSLDRRSVEKSLGLAAGRPTVVYAPTWSPYSSLNDVGEEVLKALSRLPVNVVVKLHDRSCNSALRGSGGVNWRRHLQRLAREWGFHIARGADASPYLFAADLLITDHSSVGFEFMLLDRPIVVLEAPQLLEKVRINPEKVQLLRSAADLVRLPGEVARVVERALTEPGRLSPQRVAIAGDLFYSPGTATDRAAQSIYELLSMPAPAPAAGRVDSRSKLPALARTS
jgi:CDP-glycerol glycerophosphotransferase (TagB/SpsB family)